MVADGPTVAEPATQVLKQVMNQVEAQDASSKAVRKHLEAKHLDTLTDHKLSKSQASTLAKEIAAILEGEEG